MLVSFHKFWKWYSSENTFLNSTTDLPWMLTNLPKKFHTVKGHPALEHEKCPCSMPGGNNHQTTVKHHSLLAVTCGGTCWPARGAGVQLRCLHRQPIGTPLNVLLNYSSLPLHIMWWAWEASLPCVHWVNTPRAVKQRHTGRRGAATPANQGRAAWPVQPMGGGLPGAAQTNPKTQLLPACPPLLPGHQGAGGPFAPKGPCRKARQPRHARSGL